MRPVLFNFFGIKVYGYGTMMAIGIIAAVMLLSYRAKKKGIDGDSILNMSIIAVIAGVIGGKLLYYISDLSNIIKDPSLLLNFGAGFVIYGSIIGGVIGVYIYCKMKKWNLINMFDLVIPSLPLAQGFGRIGCLLAGCCYGKETSSLLSIKFTNSFYAPNAVALIPTEIYSSIFDFLLAIFLLWYSRKERKKGRIFALYLIIYSIGRFIIEFFRGDPRGNVGFLSSAQFISIFIVLIGFFIFFYDWNKGKESSITEDVQDAEDDEYDYILKKIQMSEQAELEEKEKAKEDSEKGEP